MGKEWAGHFEGMDESSFMRLPRALALEIVSLNKELVDHGGEGVRKA